MPSFPEGEALFIWDDSMKRAVIFANGEMRDPAAAKKLLRTDDWIVAADGGAHHALACGRTPQLVIGDLDSLAPKLRVQLETRGSEFIVHPAAKDETDLELALLHVAAQGATAVLVLGALGGRLDQMLANIQLLARPELGLLEIQIADGRQTAQLVRDKMTIYGTVGDLVSLIPLGGDARGVCTSGLKWPLEDETLYFGRARGVSNEMLETEAQIRVAAGKLLCIHEPANLGTC